MIKILYVKIIGDSETSLWGLSGRERLQCMLGIFKTVSVIDDLSKLPDTASVLLIKADHLFDSRVIEALTTLRESIVLIASSGIPVAVMTTGKDANDLYTDLNDVRPLPASLQRYTLEDLRIGVQQNLKKKDPPYILLISRSNRKALESELFAASYKGVTDLVTKWLWPLPAFWVTHLCVRLSLKPNHVTLLSLLLAVLAGIAFWYGEFGFGLVSGWLMTFLDTVDGKLARVTLTSSKIGDVLDHGLDIIHPPLWYLAWGIGLIASATPLPNLELLAWLMFLAYLGGRLCEGAFQLWLAPFDIFIWRKVDSFHRLITARRNPNLLLLTASWMLGQPDSGFILVVVWHLLSTFFLSCSLGVAWYARTQHGVLHSWMEHIDPVRDRQQFAVKVFTRAPFTDQYARSSTSK